MTKRKLSDFSAQWHGSRGTIGASDEKGRRFHIWIYSTDGRDYGKNPVLYFNPPTGTERGGPGWFSTKHLPLALPKHAAVAREIWSRVQLAGLWDAAIAAHDAKEAEADKMRERRTAWLAKRVAAVELYDALNGLLPTVDNPFEETEPSTQAAAIVWRHRCKTYKAAMDALALACDTRQVWERDNAQEDFYRA